MQTSPAQDYARTGVRSVLALFSSSEIAREVHVRGAEPIQLLSLWRLVYTSNPRFVDCFSEPERLAMREFNSAVSQLVEEAGTLEAQIDQLVSLPGWGVVTARAQDALRAIAA